MGGPAATPQVCKTGQVREGDTLTTLGARDPLGPVAPSDPANVLEDVSDPARASGPTRAPDPTDRVVRPPDCTSSGPTRAPDPTPARPLPGRGRASGPTDVLHDPKPREECGVFGVWAPGEEVSRLTYFGLYALQHRGQESAGIATTDGTSIRVYKDLGLVSQVFDDNTLTGLTGHQAVGHVRYATTGATTWENAQPMLGPVSSSTLALTHNGNLTNTRELMEAVFRTSGEDLTGELGRGSSTITKIGRASCRERV